VRHWAEMSAVNVGGGGGKRDTRGKAGKTENGVVGRGGAGGGTGGSDDEQGGTVDEDAPTSVGFSKRDDVGG
jgi:hypothetical protein